MPRVRLIVEDDLGWLMTGRAERVYSLDGQCDTLDDIDEADESFKNNGLPEIEKHLLEYAPLFEIMGRVREERTRTSSPLNPTAAPAMAELGWQQLEQMA